MTKDVGMRFLIWSYYYHAIQPEPNRSYATYGKFSPADARRLDELKEMLFKCFEPTSIAAACRQFLLAKQRQEPCPFAQADLDRLFAHELTPAP